MTIDTVPPPVNHNVLQTCQSQRACETCGYYHPAQSCDEFLESITNTPFRYPYHIPLNDREGRKRYYRDYPQMIEREASKKKWIDTLLDFLPNIEILRLNISIFWTDILINQKKMKIWMKSWKNYNK